MEFRDLFGGPERADDWEGTQDRTPVHIEILPEEASLLISAIQHYIMNVRLSHEEHLVNAKFASKMARAIWEQTSVKDENPVGSEGYEHMVRLEERLAAAEKGEPDPYPEDRKKGNMPDWE